MEPRFRQAFPDRRVLIEDVPQILHRGGDDAAPARGADDIVQGAVVAILDDGRGNGRQGPLAGLDEVGGRGRVPEGVGLVGDGKIVHLVVHDDAGFGDDELAAEEQVHGRGERNGHAGRVGGDDVGGPGSVGNVVVRDWWSPAAAVNEIEGHGKLTFRGIRAR